MTALAPCYAADTSPSAVDLAEEELERRVAANVAGAGAGAGGAGGVGAGGGGAGAGAGAGAALEELNALKLQLDLETKEQVRHRHNSQACATHSKHVLHQLLAPSVPVPCISQPPV